jgi:hypothetical protein
MKHPDRIKLLFGPYRAPPLRRGDRAFCLFRDCDVVVTSWTNAPISWPRCRALDRPLGGSGLLVDEELARAVKHEDDQHTISRETVSRAGGQADTSAGCRSGYRALRARSTSSAVSR